jgi:hypothetical protein
MAERVGAGEMMEVPADKHPIEALLSLMKMGLPLQVISIQDLNSFITCCGSSKESVSSRECPDTASAK